MKRIIALILAMALCLSLASCKSKKKNKDDNNAASAEPYEISVNVSYRCEDATVSKIFEQIGGAMINIAVDGDKLKLESSLDIDYGDGANSFTETYVIADGEVYMLVSYDSDDKASTVKNKAEITDEDKATIYNRVSVVGGVSTSDFKNYSVENLGSKEIRTYTNLTEEGKIKLENIMLRQLEGAPELVTSGAAEMKVTTVDGKYDSVTIACTYEITIAGGVYTVEMTAEMDYDYRGSTSVKVPEDADEYYYVTKDKILGIEIEN